MADLLASRPSVAALARAGSLEGRAFASPAARAVAIEPVAPALRLAVRGRSGTAEAAAAALGVALPTAVCGTAVSGDIAALWLSPDEWLVIAPESRAETLGLALEAALSAIPHSVVDVSHRNTALVVAGPKAAFVLNHGCPRDLSTAAFPVGTASRTILGKAEIVLWRTAEETFRIEVWRSFAPYVADFLDEARKEFEV